MGWATLLEAWHLLKYPLWQTLTISPQVDLGSARLGGGGVERQGLLSPLNWALQVDPRDRTADAAGGARAQPEGTCRVSSPCAVGGAYRYCLTANTQTVLAISEVAVRTEWLYWTLYNGRLTLDSEGRGQSVPFCCTPGSQPRDWNQVGVDGVCEHSVEWMEITAPHVHQALYSL